VASGVEQARWTCACSTVLCAILSPDGKMVATGGYGDISLLLTDDPSAPRTDLAVPGAGVVRALAFAPSGTQLVATCGSGMFCCWDIGKGSREARRVKTVRWDGDNGRAVNFARRGALLVSASEEDGKVKFWDPARWGRERNDLVPSGACDGCGFVPGWTGGVSTLAGRDMSAGSDETMHRADAICPPGSRPPHACMG